jgi:hypothetical protein
MFKRMLALAVLSYFLVSCASWYSSDSTSKEPDSPTVGSKDSSDFLFGQAADSPSNVKEDGGVAPVVAKPQSASAAK